MQSDGAVAVLRPEGDDTRSEAAGFDEYAFLNPVAVILVRADVKVDNLGGVLQRPAEKSFVGVYLDDLVWYERTL